MRLFSIHLHLFMGTLLSLAFNSVVYAEFPSSTYPGCGDDHTLDACPPDMKNADGSYRGITWSFISYIHPDLESHVRPEELELGSGNWIDKAFQVSVGRYDVPIAIIDSGIRWSADEITPKVLLNRGELPSPRTSSGTLCTNYDCNSDGYFTVADYSADARVSISSGNDSADHYLEPSDLIAVFSDGTDGDNNGYVDDIAGWDFMWDDNDPYTSNDFGHGTGVMSDAAATLGDVGSDLGYCPNCAILPVRSSDSFMAEGNRIAQAVVYAVDRGAKVIGMATGGITNSEFLRDAFEYAHSRGVTMLVAIGDELTYHHLPPGSNEYIMPVHSIEFWPIYGVEVARTFLAFNGCNNYGAHLTVVASTNDCATGAVAVTSGIAGLVYSYGLDQGVQLNAYEVRAILTQSADDINVPESQLPNSPYFPSHPGWDQFFGYGRVNARHAVDLAVPGKIPPEAYINQPTWYEVIDSSTTTEIVVQGHAAAPRSSRYDWVLEWAPGADVRDGDFALLANGHETSAVDGTLYRWKIADIPISLLDPASPLEAISGEDPLLDKLDKVNAYSITLRLVATDNEGNQADFRKTFFLHEDPDLVAGFPRYVGPGESSPSLLDIDGDGQDEIVLGTSDGQVHILRADGSELPGWPVSVAPLPSLDPDSPANHLSGAGYAHYGIVPANQTILGNVTVTDLERDGEFEILVSTFGGLLYVFTEDGQQKQGFPVARDPVFDSDTDVTHQLDPGIAASPTAADLDGDAILEIILPAMDQKLYVWRADGERTSGFPVILASDVSEESHNVGRIFSSAVVGDIDGDRSVDIVVGSNEYHQDYPFLTYLYAIHGNGNLNASGPLLRGWPTMLIGLLSAVVPYMGDGITTTPVLFDADDDGIFEVAVASTGGVPTVVDGSGRIVAEMATTEDGWGEYSDTRELGALPYIANLEVADINLDGSPDLIAAMTAGNWGISLGLNRWMPYQDHLVVVWDANTGVALPAWPRVIEDIAMFARPAVDDLDQDGLPEVIMSSGGYAVHAWNADGIEAPGWPKFTGGWVYTSIRTGDLTGDGRSEVVAFTREGYLFAWQTDGGAGMRSAVPNRRVSDSMQSKRLRSTR